MYHLELQYSKLIDIISNDPSCYHHDFGSIYFDELTQYRYHNFDMLHGINLKICLQIVDTGIEFELQVYL